MPLQFLVKTAIAVVTPPVVCNSFPLPVTHLTAVEPPRYRRRVAILLFRDCTAIVLRRQGGDEGATAVLVRGHDGHGDDAATPLRIGPTPGGTAEVLNVFSVSAVPLRRSAVLQFSPVQRRLMTEPLRHHGDHGSATAVYAVQAVQWHRASGVTGVVMRKHGGTCSTFPQCHRKGQLF